MRIQALLTILPTLAVALAAPAGLSGCYPDPEINERPDAADVDGDGYNTLVDCDDDNANVHPDAEEKCDEIDNDCDALIDELGATDATTWYVDGDEDGFGDPAITREACEQPDFYVADATDCDDSQPTVYPGAEEICDGLDNDCNDEIDDDAADSRLYYWDFDGDGFGDPDRPVRTCSRDEWLVEDNTDCDDSVAAINPDAQEICDSVDNDCDGDIDDDDASVDPSTYTTWYVDGDGDGFGIPDEDGLKMACDGGEGYADNAEDCNDDDATLTTDCAEL